MSTATRKAGTFNCPECDKTFSRNEYVSRHRRLKHLNERPFVCPNCTKGYARSDLLLRHRKSCQASEVISRPATMNGPPITSNNAQRPRLQQQPITLAPILPIPILTPPSLFVDNEIPRLSVASTSAILIDSPLSSSSSSYLFNPDTVSACSVSPQEIPILSPASYHSSSSKESDHSYSPATPPFSFIEAQQLKQRASLLLQQQFMEVDYDHMNVGLGGSSKGSEVTSTPMFFNVESLTQDEILASAALEELLRSASPTPPRQIIMETAAIEEIQEDDPFYQDPFSPLPLAIVSSPTSRTPWHGSKLQINSGQEYSMAIDTSYWSPSNYNLMNSVDDDLENSPEALALADYFNKGGVGGITALDLGFSKNPAMFPQHLFENQYIHTEEDAKFFLPSQSLCLGYLHPWHVPPLAILSKFAAVAAKSFLPSIPIVHGPSLKLSSMSTHTAFALSVTGGAFDQSEDGGEKFSNEMLVEKRVFLVRGFNKRNGDDASKFASLQSMLLYQLLGLFHRDEQQRILSHTFHGALIMMLRELSLPTKINEAGIITVPRELEGVELELAWKHWIKVETWRRVTFIVFLADLETATHFSTAPLLPFSDLDIDLPSNDQVWNATDALSWSHAMNSSRNPTSISYLSSIRALLSRTTPELFSPDGLILAELTRLSSFPLLILSRTLSFLQMKTEESIVQMDPFRELLGGLNVFEGKENENRNVLEKIVKGRERLKKLPGGVKRGGGEGWWEGIIPTAKRSTSPSGSESEPIPEDSNAKTKEYNKLTEQIRRATKVVAQGFPEFSNYHH